jgi:hypothetical protein
MYNVGLVLARGEVVVFCDSDAMVRERFIESVVTAFAADERRVLHLDQFRNVRQDLYPFRYPPFEEVLGPGCINNVGGRPRGLVDTADPLHNRNYGACMAARRADLIAIGGADEHLDYLGHICGPYEMTFRLINAGAAELWHPTEFLYHTWHPGQAGDGNYLGPHDGRHMSTTALDALITTRTLPFVENRAVAAMRHGVAHEGDLERQLIAADRCQLWKCGRDGPASDEAAAATRLHFDYRGYRVERRHDRFVARMIVDCPAAAERSAPLVDDSPAGIRRRIDRSVPATVSAINVLGSAGILTWRAAADARRLLAAVRASGMPDAGEAPPIRRRRTAFRALPRTFVRRLRRALTECHQASASLGSMLVNLHALRRGEAGRIVLVVPDRFIRSCVRLAAALRLVPPLDVALSANPQQLTAAIGEFDRRPAPLRILIPRELYFQHRSVFAQQTSKMAVDVL